MGSTNHLPVFPTGRPLLTYRKKLPRTHPNGNSLMLNLEPTWPPNTNDGWQKPNSKVVSLSTTTPNPSKHFTCVTTMKTAEKPSMPWTYSFLELVNSSVAVKERNDWTSLKPNWPIWI